MTSNILRAALVGLPFTILGLLQVVPLLWAREQSKLGIAATNHAHQMDEATLGKLPAEWQVVRTNRVNRSENHLEGHYSVVFDLQHSQPFLDIRVSLDYPFTIGWHHLTDCYKLSGWQCLSEKIVTNKESNGWPYVEAKLRDTDGKEALLFFSLFDASGKGLSPPSDAFSFAIWQRFDKVNYTAQLPSYFQSQLFAPGMFSETQESKLLGVFLNIRESMRTFVTEFSPSDFK